ncbi:MAG: hypothetical protein AB7T49_06840 [Oligoflexales bacterium]
MESNGTFFITLRTTVALLLMGFSASCMKPISAKEDGATGSVIFGVSGLDKLDPQIHRFKVEVASLQTMQALVGENEQSLTFDLKEELVIDGINIGPKEFKVSVVDKDDSSKAYYSGTARHWVQIGSQKIAQPVVLKKINLEQNLIDLVANVKLRLDSKEPKEIVLPDDVKTAMEEGNCGVCHKDGANNKIYLKTFPFSSDRPELNSLPKLIERMAKAVNVDLDPGNEVKDMPPGPDLSPESVSAITEWYKSIDSQGDEQDIGLLPIDLVKLTWKAENLDLSGSVELKKVSPGLYEGVMTKVPEGENILATITVGNGDTMYVTDEALSPKSAEMDKLMEYEVKIPNKDASVILDVVIE